MACKHEQLKCTDNVYYCALCGASWPVPPEGDNKPSAPAEKPAEAPKRAVKRKTKKEAE